MTISMYQASVPAFIRMLDNLKGILEKGAAHAEAKKFDPAVLINSRLYPDMFPLSRQVQIATDNAKGCPSRLAGIDPPKYEDTESFRNCMRASTRRSRFSRPSSPIRSMARRKSLSC